MQHRIETNVIFNNIKDTDRVRRQMYSKLDDLEMMDVYLPFVPVGSMIVVEVNGNGALLRNAAFTLDVAGMLD